MHIIQSTSIIPKQNQKNPTKMKGINISCNSLDSTTIISSNIEITQSPSISTCSSSSSTIGGRLLDRHNPIITDEKRRGAISRSAPTTPCVVTNHNIKTPLSPLILHAPKKKSKKTTQKLYNNNNIIPKSNASNFGDDDDHGEVRRKSDCEPLDVMKKGGCTIRRKGVEHVSSPPPESSRYLLDDTSFLNVLSDFEPVLKLVPLESTKNEGESFKLEDYDTNNVTSSMSGSSHQVVVLRVSLHCRGCERKLKKHLSTMPGVTSFNIDFTAKKVTVVGDVTPLGVLSNISKVKNAQLWTPTLSSSFPTNK